MRFVVSKVAVEKVFLRVFRFSSVYNIFPSMPNPHLHLHLTLTRKNLPKSIALPETREHLERKLLVYKYKD